MSNPTVAFAETDTRYPVRVVLGGTEHCLTFAGGMELLLQLSNAMRQVAVRLPGCICPFPSQEPEQHATNCRHYVGPVVVHDREGGEL